MAKIRRSDMPQPAAAGLTERGQQTPAPTQPGHEAPSAPAPKAKRRRSSIGYTVAMIFFGAVFLVSAGLLVKRFLDDRKTENEFASLQAMIDTTATTDTPDPTGESVNPNGAKFAALRDKNSDFIGWISIDGTNLDFPVMYAPTNKDFYLRHDFNKEYSIYGVPYLDEKTTLGANAESDNLIIYGHNMKSGAMFGTLKKYLDKGYLEKHKQIRFDTIYERGTYEVIGAFLSEVSYQDEYTFRYYNFLNANNESEFEAFCVNVMQLDALKKGTLDAKYGDQLLTLSTCSSYTEEGRMFVIAKRIK